MNPEIKLAIERGTLLIILGAGTSLSSKDQRGEKMLDGHELSQLLAKEAALPFAGETLPIVYAAARARLGDKLDSILESRFRHCVPSPALATICSYPWARIYTLNIDDTLETAARRNSRQKINVRYRNDKVNDRNPFFEQLDIVKLNGSVDRLKEGIIFSPQEYGAASASPPLWYEELGEEFFRYTCLFIGTRLAEPLFFHQIERYRRVAHSTEGKSFVLTLEASEIERAGLLSLNLQHIAGTVEDFASWLERTFSAPRTPWEMAVAVHPQLQFLSKKADPASYVDLFQKISMVSRKELATLTMERVPIGKIRDFYRGFKPTWRDILDSVPAELEVFPKAIRRLQSVRENECLFVIYGPAGSGKLTTLMQLALGISEKSKLPIYFLSEPVVNLDEVIEALEESNASRYYLFLDRLSSVADGLHRIFAGKRLQKGIIVATERQNVWNSRTQSQFKEWCSDKFRIDIINEAEANKILERLERFGPWTRLAKLPPKKRMEELLQKARRQLLIGLLEATSGMGFEKIIENDYRDLTDLEQKRFVVLVGLGTVHRLNIPETLVARALPKLGIASGVPALLSRTSGIIHRLEDSLLARHPVYVEHLFENVVSKEDKAAAIHALLGAFSVYAKPLLSSVGRVAGSIFKLTVNHEFLRNMFRADSAVVLSVYETFARDFQDDALYWLQYGLALREAQQHEEALEKLRTARDAYPMKQTEHALAQQQLIMAKLSDSKVKAYSYLGEAKDTLTRLDETFKEGETDYPIVTLSEGHTQVVLKFEGSKKARELAKDYANLVEQRIRRLRANPRLRQAWKRLATFATTGMWD